MTIVGGGIRKPPRRSRMKNALGFTDGFRNEFKFCPLILYDIIDPNKLTRHLQKVRGLEDKFGVNEGYEAGQYFGFHAGFIALIGGVAAVGGGLAYLLQHYIK